ncbi:Predicted metalloprotease, contains C-terminal PDZ domain [Pseudidiomarina planktonica]|uniref:Predicted metalloprotease, contains C-terminal PDZ domain n=1 Tax=Pseudidiomarina planktonica TaxID=1323738 RepID=A0A1Y6EU04_9GAMM|nr:PDZ domain-containing protein [Pseudidiomarina planktonica]RUO65259.1 aminopeptidase [Pseudidiomarina planktonica]SMQ65776.1 Predicted metalloprotease, contains C-terminal PDZ domain [Pseudidiomarina planktonica]
MVSYKITPIDVHGHLFEIKLSIPEPATQGQRVKLPAWIPGSYMIRDFAKNIMGLYAQCHGEPVAVKLIDKHTWELGQLNGPVEIFYQAYAWDLSVRTAYLDQFWGFFNNSSLCLAVEGQTDQPCELILEPCEQHPEWQVATGMPRTSGDSFKPGSFQADSYEALIDYPFLLGNLVIEEFIAGGIKHALVLAGRNYADTARITADLARICEYQLDMFGKPAPFESYTFLTIVVGKGFGGLEHRNSTALMCSRKDLAQAGEVEIDNDYRTFLSLCSHEYFHSWNIKTLKPKVFVPYQLDAESYTEQLWFYEGMTSYYDDYVLHCAGIIDEKAYLNLIGETIARVQRGVGESIQTVTESSFLAWTKFYQQGENAPNSIISYYAKGALIGLCLDLQLRLLTDHKLTLAQVMQDLWNKYGKEQLGTEDHTFVEHLNSYPGVDLTEFMHTALRTTKPLPLQTLLQSFGVKLESTFAADDNSHNGKRASDSLPVQLGAKYKGSSQGLELLNVYANEPAKRAGLAAGDRIIAIDDLQVTDTTVKEVLSRMAPGQATKVHAFRRDELMTLTIEWTEPKPYSRVLSVTHPELINGWLTLSEEAPTD